jgi:hypothetical protein
MSGVSGPGRAAKEGKEDDIDDQQHCPLIDELGDVRARMAALERREAGDWKRFQLETFRLALTMP